MLESVPPFVEAAIYCYFAVVAAIGCYLHGRLRIGARNRTSGASDDPGEDAPGLES